MRSRGPVDIIGMNVTCNGGASFAIDKQPEPRRTKFSLGYSIPVTNADVSPVLSSLFARFVLFCFVLMGHIFPFPMFSPHSLIVNDTL
jgi:hypothetical protein